MFPATNHLYYEYNTEYSIGLADKYEYEYWSIFVFIFKDFGLNLFIFMFMDWLCLNMNIFTSGKGSNRLYML